MGQITIDDVVYLLGLERSPKSNPNKDNYDVHCPFCNHEGHTMNIHTRKGYSCLHCGSNGGTLDLYARIALGYPHTKGVNGKKITFEIKRALGHDIKSNNEPRKPLVEKPMVYESYVVPCATDFILDQTYNAMLDLPMFALSNEHKENLLRRGLSEERIVQNKYRSLDNDYGWCVKDKEAWNLFNKRKVLAEASKHQKTKDINKVKLLAGMCIADLLLEKGCTLEGVHGFYKLGDTWIFNILNGMVIPIRNFLGRIVGFQLRTDNPAYRYITLSSKDFPCGPTEDVLRIHFPMNNAEIDYDTIVFFTEGALKADTALYLLEERNEHNVFFFALPGVHNRNDLADVFEHVRRMGIKQVFNALDMDKYTNLHVLKASREINTIAKNNELDVQNKLWDVEYADILLPELKQELRDVSMNQQNDFAGVRQLMSNMQQQSGILPKLTGNSLIDTTLCIKVLSEITGKKKYPWRDSTKGIDDYLLSIKE